MSTYSGKSLSVPSILNDLEAARLKQWIDEKLQSQAKPESASSLCINALLSSAE
jgi:hypothetical protein